MRPPDGLPTLTGILTHQHGHHHVGVRVEQYQADGELHVREELGAVSGHVEVEEGHEEAAQGVVHELDLKCRLRT